MYTWHRTTGKAYLTFGTGYGRTRLSAFDAAELDANIFAANALQVTSFIPPHWQIVNSKTALADLTDHGVFLPMAFAHAASKTRPTAASVTIGINQDSSKASIITEHAGEGTTREKSLRESELALRDAFNSRHWEIDKLEQAAIEGKPRDGLYVCVLVAVVFLPDPH